MAFRGSGRAYRGSSRRGGMRGLPIRLTPGGAYVVGPAYSGPAAGPSAPQDQAKVTRILGVDTALRCTGYGIIDSDGRSFEPVDCGVIRNAARLSLSECLRRLAGGVRELAKSYAPDVAAIEGAFYFKNARTAMVLGMARGAVVSALADFAIPQFEYAPRRVKQAVCGHGNASKEQVKLLISQVLGIEVANLPDDATDALAMAICHAQALTAMQGIFLAKPL